MSIAAMARAPLGRWFDHPAPPPVAPFVAPLPDDDRPVYRVMAHQAPYAPFIAETHWRTSGEAMTWSLLAFPCGTAVAAVLASSGAMWGGVLAAGAAVSAGVGCATVVLAPILVPTGVCLAVFSGGTVISGGMAAASAIGIGAAVTMYEGTRAVVYASKAVTREVVPPRAKRLDAWRRP